MCVHDKSEPCIATIHYNEQYNESVVTIMFDNDDDIIEELCKGRQCVNTVIEQMYLKGYHQLKVVDESQFSLDYLMAHNECACAAI